MTYLKPLKSWPIGWKTRRQKHALTCVFMMISALSISHPAHAMESLKPAHPVNSVIIAARVLEKTISNTHYKPIGACQWVTGLPPRTSTGTAIEQYLPDLVVTVSNRAGSNPWIEAGLAYENEAALKGYQAIFAAAMGMPFDVADSSSQASAQHMNEERTRIVSVLGSPSNLYRLPKVSHKPETHFGAPYYSSLADAVMDRTEGAEMAYMATHPNLLIGHDIGTSMNHWGHEVPRLMRVTQPSRFRASVVAAMHAADIVTNEKGLHVAHYTTNTCGKNCVVSNVIYDPKQKHVIWQEVYPNNRNIKPGDSSDFGIEDDKAGNGNYVFVLWRKYRGCVQQKGRLFASYPHVGNPQKR